MIDATIQKVDEELDEHFSYAEYLKWFAKTLGTNVARMHKAGYSHRFLHSQNVTADCGIMDNDSVKELPQDWLSRELDKSEDHDKGGGNITGGIRVSKRLRSVLLSIPSIAEEVKKVTPRELKKIYKRAYKQELSKPKKTQET